MNEITQQSAQLFGSSLPAFGRARRGRTLSSFYKKFDSQILIDRRGESSTPEKRHSANPVYFPMCTSRRGMANWACLYMSLAT